MTGEGVQASAADRVLDVVNVLIGADQVRVAEVASVVGVSRPTAHRLLNTLVRHGIAQQEYHNGPYSLSLGFAARAAKSPRAATLEIARQHTRALCDEIGETAHFAVLQGNSCRFVVGSPSEALGSTPDRTGIVLPAHATAPGKAMLAVLPAETVRQLYPRGVQTLTDATLGSADEIGQHLNDVLRLGYATNFAESEPGLAAVAVAVRDGEGKLAGALAISGPIERLLPARVPHIAMRMQKAALAFQGSLTFVRAADG